MMSKVTSFAARACEDLPSVNIFNEGYNFAVHVSSSMASLMFSRHRSLLLESLPAGCTRGYASCVYRESSVSSQHALPRAAGGLLVLQRCSHPSARCACRVLSSELDCSGRCLAKRLHEPCSHAYCTNSTPVKLQDATESTKDRVKRKRTRRSRRSSSGQTERLHIQDKAKESEKPGRRRRKPLRTSLSMHECNQHEQC